jgi:NDP-sugar pyrophosphorylase family protein
MLLSSQRMITQAFVLGAGLGTRLRPLTDELPKPLLPVFHKPLITFALDHLIAIGVRNFVINTHHLAEEFKPVFGGSGSSYAAADVRLVHEPVLLETGGGIKNAQPFLASEPFIVYSGDILTDIDIGQLVEEHARGGNDVTLALRRTGFPAGVVLKEGRVIDITRGSTAPDNFDYANISVWNPKMFARFVAGQKISFIPVLVDWIRQGGKVGGIVLDQGGWFNIGSRAEYLDVHRTIAAGAWRPRYRVRHSHTWPAQAAPGATVDRSAQVEGCTAIGPDARVGAGARLNDTIVWTGAQIASRSDLQGCIVRSRKTVQGTHRDADI